MAKRLVVKVFREEGRHVGGADIDTAVDEIVSNVNFGTTRKTVGGSGRVFVKYFEGMVVVLSLGAAGTGA